MFWLDKRCGDSLQKDSFTSQDNSMIGVVGGDLPAITSKVCWFSSLTRNMHENMSHALLVFKI